MTATSWLSFREFNGLLVYYTHLMSYRCAIREVRVGIDSAMPDKVLKMPPCDPRDPSVIPHELAALSEAGARDQIGLGGIDLSRRQRVGGQEFPALRSYRRMDSGKGDIRIRFQTADTRPHSRDGRRPRFACRCPSEEGAGNAGCALHPRSRVQIARVKTHTSIQGSGEHPTFPAQWLYGLSRAHPGVSGSSRLRRLRIAGSSAPGRADVPSADLTPTTEASGPHGFAVRFGTARLARSKRPLTEFIPPCNPVCAHDAAASTATPVPTFGNDGQRPLLGDGMA